MPDIVKGGGRDYVEYEKVKHSVFLLSFNVFHKLPKNLKLSPKAI